MKHGLKQAVAVGEDLGLGQGLAVGVERVTGLAFKGDTSGVAAQGEEHFNRAVVELLGLGVAKHDGLDEPALDSGREFHVDRQLVDSVHLGADSGSHRVDLGLSHHAAGDQVVAVTPNAV